MSGKEKYYMEDIHMTWNNRLFSLVYSVCSNMWFKVGNLLPEIEGFCNSHSSLNHKKIQKIYEYENVVDATANQRAFSI